jgi:general secretion pathway protein D
MVLVPFGCVTTQPVASPSVDPPEGEGLFVLPQETPAPAVVDRGSMVAPSNTVLPEKAAIVPGPEEVVEKEKEQVPPTIVEEESVKPASPPPSPSPLEAALEADRIKSLDFQNEKLSNVLKVVSAVMGVNVVAKENISDLEITVYMKDVTPRTALESLCRQYELSYEEVDDGLRLMKVEDFGRVEVSSDGTINELMFKGMPLVNALGVISEKTGRNVVCKNNISEIPVHFYISQVTLQTAIEIICKKYDLWYKKDKSGNYFVLMRAEDYGEDMLIDYRPKTRVYDLKYVSAPQLAEVLALAMGNRVEYTPPNTLRSYEHLKTPDIEDDEASVDAAKTDVDFTKDISAPEFEEGFLTSEKIEELVSSRLDLMLTAEDVRRINQKIGFALVAIFLRNNAIIASSTDETLLNEIGDLIAELDTPTPQVLIETKILRLSLTDNFTSFFDLEIQRAGDNSTFNWSSAFPSVSTYGSAVYNYIDDKYKVDATLQLLKDDGILNAISTPMIVAAQNSEGEAFVGTIDYPLVTGIDAESVVNDEGTVISVLLNPVITKQDIGVRLRMTPEINADGSVTLRLHIEESEIAAEQAVIPYYDGKAETLQNYPVDVVDEETIDTIITIPAGHTLALGGLVDERENEMENKMPFLGDLPLVGFFFKEVKIEKTRTERVFLLKPHIMMLPEETGGVSREALDGSEHPYVKESKADLFGYDKERKRLIRK